MAQLSEKIWFPAILIITVCIIVVAVYRPVLSAKALWFDDSQYVIDNVLVQNPGWASVKKFITEVLEPSTVTGYYQPLTMISLMLDHATGGSENNLRPFHITSLALHTANTALVIVLLHLLFGNIWAAAAAGLLFGLHPMTIESIPWAAERKTLLAAFFALWSLIFYVCYARSDKWKFYFGCILMYLLALMSKPASIPLPAVMLLMDYWPLKKISAKSFLQKMPLFVLGGVFAVITYISQNRTADTISPIEYGATHVLLVLCHNIIFYLYKMILPVNLSFFYAFPKPFGLSDVMVLTGVIGTCILIPVLLISLRWTRAAFTGWLIFFVAVFPAIGVVGFADVIAADRFAYLPSLGLLMMLVASLIWLSKKRQIIIVVVIVLLAGAEAFAVQRYLRYWKDTITLAEYSLTLSPNSAEIYNVLACAYGSLGRYEQEIEVCQKAIKINPEYVELYANLGAAFGRLGRYKEAIQAFRQAIELTPDFAGAHLGLGAAYLATGDKKSAVKEYEILKALDPGKADLLFNLLNQRK